MAENTFTHSHLTGPWFIFFYTAYKEMGLSLTFPHVYSILSLSLFLYTLWPSFLLFLASLIIRDYKHVLPHPAYVNPGFPAFEVSIPSIEHFVFSKVNVVNVKDFSSSGFVLFTILITFLHNLLLPSMFQYPSLPITSFLLLYFTFIYLRCVCGSQRRACRCWCPPSTSTEVLF